MQKLQIQIKERLKQINFIAGKNLWKILLSFLEENFPAHSVFLITDSQVAKLYKDVAQRQLSCHKGFREILVFPSGEQSKSRQQKELLEDQLLASKAGRDTVIIALGGGVTGDLAGYIAATFQRGIPLIHMPTTLLAQVDSSLGGKVGINHPVGKNMIGAFYQPEAIFADTNFLTTLSEDEFINGMAEIVKYAVILDDELWVWLEKFRSIICQRNEAILEKIILRCAELKIKVVEADEKETGYRSILNFGHTVGHALEKLSDYKIKHGFAIAGGMKIAALLSHQLCGYPLKQVQRLNWLIKSYKLDQIDVHKFSIDDIWSSIITDKKSRQQIPRFSLLDSQNQSKLFYSIKKTELQNAFIAS